MNQGVWVDILIPDNAKPGKYSGNVAITISGKKYKTIPVSIRVYDFALSDTSHLKNMFGYYPGYIARRHNIERNSDEYYNLDLKYHQLAHRHRFDLVCGVDNLKEMDLYYKGILQVKPIMRQMVIPDLEEGLATTHSQ
jgi:hypothetical protein